MYIERLHLKGFKSFGASLELLLSPGFTAIVGPNGSGKSNLLDALRWALGEAGSQRLRIVKQGDLLFSGSVTLPPASRAEVTLLLRSSMLAGRAEDRARGAAQCILKRSYSPETGTVLTVDGERLRLSDLDEVKRLWHLEGDQFAFIGQGEVAEAIHQRPAQRRAHLEVLFGIDQYRKKRNETSQKLAAASEETLRLGALAAELSNRREEIAPAVEKALAAKKLTDELDDKRRGYYFFRRRLLEEKSALLEDELRALREEETLRLRWKELWEAMYTRSVRRCGEQEERVKRLLGDRDELVARREGLRRSCFACAASIREILTRRRSLGEEQTGVVSRLESLMAESDDLKRKEAALESEHGALAAERELLRRRVRELHEAIDADRRRKHATTNTLAALSGELETLRSRLVSRRSFLESCGADLAVSEESARSMEEALRDASERLLMLEKQEPEVVEAHSDIFARCRTTGGALQSARKEASSLEGALEDLRSAEDSMYPEPVRFLTAADRLGKLPVPVKVAADAFTCPQRVTSALEAYLGGRQYWVLVKTLAEAGRCIDMLKERRAGRATFLPLERSRPRFPQSRFSLPKSGVVGWAMDLVSVDREWEPAVMHLLGDLLVVERYDDGAALVNRGASFPIVSLDGEVFATSGTVSGGRARSSAGAIERRSRIVESEEKLKTLKRRIAELTRALAEEEALERARAAEKDEWARLLRETKKEVEEKRRELEMERSRRDRLANEHATGGAEASAWETRISAIETEMKELMATVVPSAENADVSALPARLKEIEGACVLLEERLSSVRALRERAGEELARSGERRRSLLEEERAASLREQEERRRLSQRGKEQYRIFLELREILGELDRVHGKERALAARSAKVSARSRAAVERAGTLRTKADALVQQRENLAEELRRLIEAWDDEHPYDAALAPGVDEGEAIASAVRRLERDLRALGPVDWGALSEDTSLAARIAFLGEQLSDVRAAMDELRAIIEETDRHVGVVFTGALDNINIRFDALFRRLFGGGEARLQLLAPQSGSSEGGEEDETAETAGTRGNSAAWDRGVEIVARPPGKHLQNLAQLSGGEQTLTAIAYLFASMEVAGVPLAVLDEVDAALDESNLLRFGELAREYARPSAEEAFEEGENASGSGIQLVVMTHRRATMERADILYGVTLAEPGLSKVVGIRVEDWVEPGADLKARRAPAVAALRARQ